VCESNEFRAQRRVEGEKEVESEERFKWRMVNPVIADTWLGLHYFYMVLDVKSERFGTVREVSIGRWRFHACTLAPIAALTRHDKMPAAPIRGHVG